MCGMAMPFHVAAPQIWLRLLLGLAFTAHLSFAQKLFVAFIGILLFLKSCPLSAAEWKANDEDTHD